MNIRSTQNNTFALVHRGISFNMIRLGRAQEQAATGKRILRPSDDPNGAARALTFRKQLARMEGIRGGITGSRPVVEAGASALQNVSGLLADARALMVQGLNGTLDEHDREVIGAQIDAALDALLDEANTLSGDRYLFAGTATNRRPFEVEGSGDERRVVYRGDRGVTRVATGFGPEVQVNIPGSELFDAFEYSGVDFAGFTGIRLGTSANAGRGYEELDLRHDATVGALGSGLAFVNGGAADTILNAHTLTIDSVAGTVQLDGGPALAIPDPAAPGALDFAVTDESGAELHLDFSGYDGSDSVSSVQGDGSISFDGTSYVALAFDETDLQLQNPATGAVLHVDTGAVRRAGRELVSYSGAASVFDVLRGAAEDLKNGGGLAAGLVVERLQLRLGELERHHQNVLVGLGGMGARLQRLQAGEERLDIAGVNVQGLLSSVEDADMAAVILEMTQAEQTLQVAQMTGARLIQQTLLNYLR